MPIYGKKTSGTKRPMALGNGMLHWGCEPYKVCTNDESRLTLTHFMTRSNLMPIMHLYGKNIEMFIFLQLFKPKLKYLQEMFNLIRQWFYMVLYKYQMSS